MFNISIAQALKLWSYFWRAYFGKAKYGGDEAEIYTDFLLPNNHESLKERAKQLTNDDNSVLLEEIREIEFDILEIIYSLLTKFSEDNDCTIEVDERRLGKWFLKQQLCNRYYIKVIKAKG